MITMQGAARKLFSAKSFVHTLLPPAPVVVKNKVLMPEGIEPLAMPGKYERGANDHQASAESGPHPEGAPT